MNAYNYTTEMQFKFFKTEFYKRTQLMLSRKKGVLANVVFGQPGLNCKKHGICKINLIKDYQISTFNKERNAIARIKKINNEIIRFYFYKNSVNIPDFLEQFENETFKINESVEIEIPEKYTLQKGHYPIKIYFDCIQLDINFK